MKCLLTAAAFCIATPAVGQHMDHAGHAMPQPEKATEPEACAPEHAAMGHCTPAGEQPAPPPKLETTADPSCPPEHAAMGHCTPAKREAPSAPGGTALPAGNAPAPHIAAANYADRIWGKDAMAPVRDGMMKEHGGMTFSQVMLNLAEARIAKGRDSYAWDGEAWFGGDIHRLTIKSEGEGEFGGKAESAEIQVLYSRAIGPYFNLQAGVRQDITPRPERTYASVGFEGLAPYWFDVEGAVFLSDKGDVLGRLEGYYDQRITQRLILQPRAEVNLSAQTMRAERIGAGLVDAEAGLRLRYELAREFAPYIGVSWERRLGETARLARDAGEETGGFSFVAGIRAWF